MAKPHAANPAPGGLSHLRVTINPAFYFGPGRADLLEGIAETGSIAAAVGYAELMGRLQQVYLDVEGDLEDRVS